MSSVISKSDLDSEIKNITGATKYDQDKPATSDASASDSLDLPSGGTKFDSGKPSMALLPPRATEMVAKVFSFGAKKYDSWNLCSGFKYTRLLSACLRHVFAYIRGEEKDPESGESHLAHAICCLMMLLELVLCKVEGLDDRIPLRGDNEQA